jgi:hypothetical protein
MVKGRREGICEDCEERHGKRAIRLIVDYEKQAAAKKGKR